MAAVAQSAETALRCSSSQASCRRGRLELGRGMPNAFRRRSRVRARMEDAELRAELEASTAANVAR